MGLENIFNIKSETQFNAACLQTFDYQYQNCQLYRNYCDALNRNLSNITHYRQIPFLPIEFFKNFDIIASGLHSSVTFSSSGTTGSQTSKHLVADEELYKRSFRTAFNQFYGDYSSTAVLALLPSYLERTGSSLIYMVEDIIQHSTRTESGFFLHNHQQLYEQLVELKKNNVKTILFGVTFGLLDFIEQYQLSFPELIIIETGGMKGRRKEMVREEVHKLLMTGFGVPHIHSEYGMTELLSQAYSYGKGLFHSPTWMKILIRDTNDPFTWITDGKSGAVNVIDLANIYSCSFIATQDLGKVYDNGSFEILGRYDHSDVRGCNLLVQ